MGPKTLFLIRQAPNLTESLREPFNASKHIPLLAAPGREPRLERGGSGSGFRVYIGFLEGLYRVYRVFIGFM